MEIEEKTKEQKKGLWKSVLGKEKLCIENRGEHTGFA